MGTPELVDLGDVLPRRRPWEAVREGIAAMLREEWSCLDEDGRDAFLSELLDRMPLKGLRVMCSERLDTARWWDA